MQKIQSLLIVLLATLALMGCSSSKPEAASKVLRVAAPGDVLSLDSSIATDGFSFEVIQSFTEGLVNYAADDSIVPAVALTWDVSADGKEYVFHLNPDAKWSNGDPVTASDFVFAWQRLADPATASEFAWMLQTAYVLNAADIASGTKAKETLGVEAIDSNTLMVNLDTAVPYFLQLITFPSFLPINETFMEAQGDSYATSAATLLSNGPFVLTDWVQGSLITTAKNENYVDAASVKIDGVEWHIIPEPQTIKLEYEQGNLDVATLTGDLISNYIGTEDFYPILNGYLWCIPFNQESANPAMSNDNFRLAIAWAIDRSFIIEEKLIDGSIVAKGIVPKGLATGPTGNDFRTDAPVYFGYDVAKAQAYWDAAKTELESDTVIFDLLVEDASIFGINLGIPEYIKTTLEKNLVGVTVNIVTTTKKDRYTRMQAGEFDAVLTRWATDYNDPLNYLNDLLVTDMTFNFGQWSNPEYDALISSSLPGGNLAVDLNSRWDALIAAEKIALDKAIVIPMWQSGSAMIIKPNISGIEYHVVSTTNYKNTVIE